MNLSDLRLAVIGCGRIGESVVGGLLDGKSLTPDRIVVTARQPQRLAYLREHLGVRATSDNREAVHGADLVMVAVKPYGVGDVLRQLSDVLTPQQVVVSVAAAVSTSFMEKALGRDIPVIRAMPNTPCLHKVGMTAVCAGKFARPEHLNLAREIFQAVGRCLVVEERHMNAVTGLSASGPAFIYIIIESLAEAGVKVGLPRDVATELAAQTVLGSASMVLTTGEHPAKLKDQVTTPAGCTVDGILELEEGGLRVTLIKAVVRAARRAAELVDG